MRIRLGLGILILIFGVLSVLVLSSIRPTQGVEQAAFVVLGLVTYIGVQIIPSFVWKNLAIPMYIVTVLLLVATLIYGRTAKGAVRWVPIGPVHVQVSEIAKPVVALTLSLLIMKIGLSTQKSLIWIIGIAGVPWLLVFIQPDLGSALVLFAITGGILLTHLKNLKLLIPWVIVGMISIVLAWQFVLYPYQKARILSFVSAGDHEGSYNAQQAQIAVGSGKMMGRGLGKGVQSNLKFLPEFHTDFFFASYAEELGFVGVLMLLLLYLTLFGLLLYQSHLLVPFDQIYRTGLLYGLLFQTAVHVGMNIGVSPVTGIPLPFLSSGGSSFVSMALALGLAMSFSQRKKGKLHQL